MKRLLQPYPSRAVSVPLRLREQHPDPAVHPHRGLAPHCSRAPRSHRGPRPCSRSTRPSSSPAATGCSGRQPRRRLRRCRSAAPPSPRSPTTSSLSRSTSRSCASVTSMKLEPMVCWIATFAAAIASSRNCVLLTERKFDDARFSAVITSSVISTSMIRLITRAVPRSRWCMAVLMAAPSVRKCSAAARSSCRRDA